MALRPHFFDGLDPADGEAVDATGPVPSAVGVILRSIDMMQTRIAVDTTTVPPWLRG